eukprot:SAG31_NODE_2139_length_6349_cov_2.773636_3_plen_193_part_00
MHASMEGVSIDEAQRLRIGGRRSYCEKRVSHGQVEQLTPTVEREPRTPRQPDGVRQSNPEQNVPEEQVPGRYSPSLGSLTRAERFLLQFETPESAGVAIGVCQADAGRTAGQECALMQMKRTRGNGWTGCCSHAQAAEVAKKGSAVQSSNTMVVTGRASRYGVSAPRPYTRSSHASSPGDEYICCSCRHFLD